MSYNHVLRTYQIFVCKTDYHKNRKSNTGNNVSHLAPMPSELQALAHKTVGRIRILTFGLEPRGGLRSFAGWKRLGCRQVASASLPGYKEEIQLRRLTVGRSVRPKRLRRFRLRLLGYESADR